MASNDKRYTKALAKFICEKISEGMNITEISKKFPDKVPTANTMHKWRERKPEFREMTIEAYESYFHVKLDEYEYITKTAAEILYPDYDFRQAAEARKARMKGLEYQISAVAPLLTRTWNKANKLEVEGLETNSGPQIVIMNYSDESLMKDITPNKLEDDKDE